MTDDADEPTTAGIESLADPETLVDDEESPFEETTREFEGRRFDGLRERHENIDGLVQVALVSDGRLLLQGWNGPDEWAPPGFSVGEGQDWATAARQGVKELTGVDVTLEDIVLVEELTFERADAEESFSSYGVSFGASLVDEDSEFAENPAISEGSQFAGGNTVLEWFDEVPTGVSVDHVNYVERFVEYAQNR